MKTNARRAVLRRCLPAALAGAVITTVGCTSPTTYHGPRPYRAAPSPPHVPHVPRVPRPPSPPSMHSDARLKTGVAGYHRGLDSIEAIRPVSFRYRSDNPLGLDPDRQHVGVIAQDLEPVLPEAVGRDAAGLRTVDPNPVLWSAVNAIRELKAQNDQLKQRVAELEKQHR